MAKQCTLEKGVHKAEAKGVVKTLEAEDARNVECLLWKTTGSGHSQPEKQCGGNWQCHRRGLCKPCGTQLVTTCPGCRTWSHRI